MTLIEAQTAAQAYIDACNLLDADAASAGAAVVTQVQSLATALANINALFPAAKKSMAATAENLETILAMVPTDADFAAAGITTTSINAAITLRDGIPALRATHAAKQALAATYKRGVQ